MLIFLFSILLICFGIYCYIMDQKLSTQKTQLKIISRQNRELKSKIETSRCAEGPIVIKYKLPLFKSGTIKESCSLYLSPIEISPVLSNIVKSTTVEIQDSADIFDISWYEVSINSQTTINNKGWIKKDNIITLDDTVSHQEEIPT
ncbi:hypothetical protein KTC92_13520 [Clostridium sp. CM027]|uniref:hypothetical protein n=1 Tax=Clostridium sp. CM027 TaxID=2849865 RepID=UPI001C6EBD61|nr:hypothetical protein [Clostridium sp. CM027]MBW9145029.1 hypothetical protein [Clostridium sp. CM027]UVE40160.1 hypothetical protein KTC92_13520 [Clostridium sp. CM027]